MDVGGDFFGRSEDDGGLGAASRMKTQTAGTRGTEACPDGERRGTGLESGDGGGKAEEEACAYFQCRIPVQIAEREGK